MFKDKNLSCKDCGSDFTFTASEQEFYAEKGFKNEPARCPKCRAAKKAQGKPNRGQDRTRKMFPATCAECGKSTMVPFQPTGDKPVYCRDCFQSNNKSRY